MIREVVLSSLASLALASCGGPGERSYYAYEDRVPGLDSDGDPFIQVDPARVDFGFLWLSEEDELIAEVTIFNIGEADLNLQGVQIEDPEAPFEASHLRSVLIRPGEQSGFEITFAPDQAGAWETHVLIESDDPYQPVVEIAVLGEAIEG